MNDEVNNFIDNYRNSLDRQKDLGMINLDNNRRNAFTNIMSGANKVGMMYSNFPEREMIKYDTETYTPAKAKLQTTYQTGLDKLRSNSASFVNTLASINEAIADLNETNQGGSKHTALNEAGDWLDETGTFRNSNNDKLRMGSVLKHSGITNDAGILEGAKKVLNETEYTQLKNIYDRMKGTNTPNFYYNVGDSWVNPSIAGLTQEENDFLGRLGLSFK